MGKFLFLSVFLVSYQLSFAASLDDLIAAQTQTTISPVSINNTNLMGGERHAAALCMTLGFTELVDFKDEDCSAGEDLLFYGSIPNLPSITTLKKSRACDKWSKRLQSVTCSK